MDGRSRHRALRGVLATQPGEAVERLQVRHASHAGAPNNLPVEISSFIGRDGDISRGVALLAEIRLLTLTGAGGCGKTRLAQRIAGRVLHRYPGGVWWTELARLTDEGLIADEVADVLGVRVPPGFHRGQV